MTSSSNNNDHLLDTSTNTTTDNDLMIAQLLAKEEQELIDSELASRIQQGAAVAPSTSNSRGSLLSRISSTLSNSNHSGNTTTIRDTTRRTGILCPGNHGYLNEYPISTINTSTSSSMNRVRCDQCQLYIMASNETAFGCKTCNYDICNECYHNALVQQQHPQQQQQQQQHPTPTQQQQQQQQRAMIPPPNTTTTTTTNNNNRTPPTHMCVVPCILGGNICVEMMVDTGAQCSVISHSLVQQLGLVSKIDTTQQGIAAGVGRAKIVGKLYNIICELGHVEFAMDFLVLETNQDNILLLGLDQMRKYNCFIDLQNDIIIFGGRDGVEVKCLPPDEQHPSSSQRGGSSPPGCPVM